MSSLDANSNCIIGRLNIGLRNLDLKDIVKYSEKQDWCGRTFIAIRLFFSGKGIITERGIKNLLKDHPKKDQILRLCPNLATVYSTMIVAENTLAPPVKMKEEPKPLKSALKKQKKEDSFKGKKIRFNIPSSENSVELQEPPKEFAQTVIIKSNSKKSPDASTETLNQEPQLASPIEEKEDKSSKENQFNKQENEKSTDRSDIKQSLDTSSLTEEKEDDSSKENQFNAQKDEEPQIHESKTKQSQEKNATSTSHDTSQETSEGRQFNQELKELPTDKSESKQSSDHNSSSFSNHDLPKNESDQVNEERKDSSINTPEEEPSDTELSSSLDESETKATGQEMNEISEEEQELNEYEEKSTSSQSDLGMNIFTENDLEISERENINEQEEFVLLDDEDSDTNSYENEEILDEPNVAIESTEGATTK